MLDIAQKNIKAIAISTNNNNFISKYQKFINCCANKLQLILILLLNGIKQEEQEHLMGKWFFPLNFKYILIVKGVMYSTS